MKKGGKRPPLSPFFFFLKKKKKKCAQKSQELWENMKVDELLFSENYTTEMGIESIVNKVKVNFTGNYETHMAQSMNIAQGG